MTSLVSTRHFLSARQRAIFFGSKESGKKKLPHVLVLSKFLACSLKFLKWLELKASAKFLTLATRNLETHFAMCGNLFDISIKITRINGISSYKLKFMSVKISRRISFLGIIEILAQKLKICLDMEFCGTFSLQLSFVCQKKVNDVWEKKSGALFLCVPKKLTMFGIRRAT